MNGFFFSKKITDIDDFKVYFFDKKMCHKINIDTFHLQCSITHKFNFIRSFFSYIWDWIHITWYFFQNENKTNLKVLADWNSNRKIVNQKKVVFFSFVCFCCRTLRGGCASFKFVLKFVSVLMWMETVKYLKVNAEIVNQIFWIYLFLLEIRVAYQFREGNIHLI